MVREYEQESGGELRQVVYTSEGQRSIDIVCPGGLLSKEGIIRHYRAGNIVIDPYNPENVGGASYDVSLGEYYWREKKFDGKNGLGGYINLWSEEAAAQMWVGPFKAMAAMEFAVDILGIAVQDFFDSMDNIYPEDKVIPLEQGENVLTHTKEFIGGNLRINTAMQARSSLGRSGITVCRCVKDQIF